MRGRGRLIVAIVAAALAVELVIALVLLLGRSPRGPASSSFAVGPRGASGLASLLDRGGHPVDKRQVPVDLEPVDPARDTVVVVGGARPHPRELTALRTFLDGGGRLVVAGDDEIDPWVAELVGRQMTRGGELLACRRLSDVPETRGVDDVESSGQSGFIDTSGAEPILGCRGAALAVVAKVGQGRLVVVADPDIFQNYLLPVRDNATFAVTAMGGRDRQVVFLEHLHGFDAQSGLAALPGGWLLGLAGLVVAGILALLAHRRPEPVPTSMPVVPEAVPSRRSRHPAAIADRLVRRPLPEAAPPVQAVALRALARTGRLPANAAPADLYTAAQRLGIAEADVTAVLSPHPTEPAVRAAARILATCSATTTREPVR